MVHIDREAVLPADPATLWTTATPPSGWEEWLSLHVRWPAPPPTQVQVGTTFKQVVSLLGIPVPMTWTVTEYDAPSVFAMAGQAVVGVGVGVAIRFDIAEASRGSSLKVSADLTGALVAGSLSRTVQKYADTQLSVSVATLMGLVS
jgi:hypothetical protein